MSTTVYVCPLHPDRTPGALLGALACLQGRRFGVLLARSTRAFGLQTKGASRDKRSPCPVHLAPNGPVPWAPTSFPNYREPKACTEATPTQGCLLYNKQQTRKSHREGGALRKLAPGQQEFSGSKGLACPALSARSAQRVPAQFRIRLGLSEGSKQDQQGFAPRTWPPHLELRTLAGPVPNKPIIKEHGI